MYVAWAGDLTWSGGSIITANISSVRIYGAALSMSQVVAVYREDCPIVALPGIVTGIAGGFNSPFAVAVDVTDSFAIVVSRGPLLSWWFTH